MRRPDKLNKLHFRNRIEKVHAMQRSREIVTSVKSVIEREEVLLAKIAPVFANLSKIVKSSSFISNSSGTASMMRSGVAYGVLDVTRSGDQVKEPFRVRRPRLFRARHLRRKIAGSNDGMFGMGREISSRTVL